MEIKYPWVILLAIAAMAGAWLIRRRAAANPQRVANTELVKQTEVYRRLVRTYHIKAYVLLGGLGLSIILTAILAARIITVTETSEDLYNRDIMLCMDVSGSMDTLNSEIVDTYMDLVQAMDGERFGISIFDSSSYLLLPLTDDYDYIMEVLESLQQAYGTIAESEQTQTDDTISYYGGDDLIDAIGYISAGTTTGLNGGSLTGEGLASCVYDFPNLTSDTARTRVIVLSSDNYIYGEQIVDVVGAAKLAQKYGIHVYVLAPEGTGGTPAQELRQAASIAGGEFYMQTAGQTASNMVESIETTEKSLMQGTRKVIETDHPEIPYAMLVVTLIVVTIMEVWLW